MHRYTIYDGAHRELAEADTLGGAACAISTLDAERGVMGGKYGVYDNCSARWHSADVRAAGVRATSAVRKEGSMSDWNANASVTLTRSEIQALIELADSAVTETEYGGCRDPHTASWLREMRGIVATLTDSLGGAP